MPDKPLSDAAQEAPETCGCKCVSEVEHVLIRVGSVECRYCHADICHRCCVEVRVDGSDMPEFRCHDANAECVQARSQTAARP